MAEPTHARLLTQRLETDPESVERDLFKLVLTIIELVRQLMEAQALRRVDEGDLTDEQVEALGLGLMPPRGGDGGPQVPLRPDHRGPQHRPRTARHPALRHVTSCGLSDM